MDSKQLRHNYLFQVTILILVVLFVIPQTGFADDDDRKRSWRDRITSYFQSDNDDDERRTSSRDDDGDRDRDRDRDDDDRDRDDHDRDRDDHDRDRDDDDKDDDDDRPPPGGTPLVNFVAIHDSSSPQYNRNCDSCHAEIHTRQSLNPSIPDAHVAMLPFSPGEGNNKCTWCHRSVDLIEAGSPKETGNTIRKRIDPRLCSLCHGPSGPGKRFYAVDFPAVQMDGADLYGLTCSGCHGPLSNPDDDVQGEDAGDIRDAIDENEGGMGVLRVLSDAQINAIAAALAGQASPLPPPDGTPPPPPPPPAAVVANPDGANATQGVATAINVITNDSGSGINLTAFDSASNQSGTVSCTTAGLCNYTSAASFTGIDTFGYTISDGLTSDSTTVTVTVSSGAPPPPPPVVANPDSANATQGVTTQINVLANDSGSGLTITAFDANSNQGGTVICSATMCNYTSAANFTGTDTFSYSNSDGVTSDIATVTVTVTAPALDGAALYATNCAACHNPLPGNQQGASANLIQDAINNNTGGMGGLNFLTTEEIQAISAAMQ